MCSTAAIPIAKLGLADDVIAKIDRYLNVTRSSLLFSARVMLIEGLSEGLLLPAMAEHRLFITEPDRAALARFRAATLVAIDGVDFEPYVQLLLKEFGGHRLADRVVVVTDQDPGTAGEHRPHGLSKVAESLGASERLFIRVAPNTLEAALFAAGNETLLRELFLELHPKSEERWKERVESKRRPGKRANAFNKLLHSAHRRKGDFAQRLALRIEDKTHAFTVPNYLKLALGDLVNEGG